MSDTLRLKMLALFSCVLLGNSISANELVADPERSVVGSAIDYRVVPTLSKPSRTGDYQLWSKRIEHKDANFIKIHFKNFNLLDGDTLEIVTPAGRVVETLVGMGPKSRVNFWGLSVQGDATDLRFEYRGEYKNNPPFVIDRIITGTAGNLFSDGDDATRGFCLPSDFAEATCYLDDPKMASAISATAGVIAIDYFGDGADALTCTASNISANNTIMTNEHCIPDQLTCDDAEFIFNFRKTSCDPDSTAVNDWVSFRCDEVLVASPPADLAFCALAPNEVDMTLVTTLGDPAAQFGYIELDAEPMTSGEDIFIVQHPNLSPQNVDVQIFTPQKVTVGGGADVIVDGDTLRYNNTLDTSVGSSGSPVFRVSSNKIVALHHCGYACWDSAVRNNGALATTIAPLVADFTCSAALKLNYGSTNGLSEVIGNGNGSVDPGESWRFNATAVNNTCALDATNVFGVVAPGTASTQAVSIYNNSLQFGAISAGESGAIATTFSVPATATCGANIAFDLTSLQDEMNGTVFAPIVDALSVPVGSSTQTIVSNENFDNGIGTWTTVNAGTGTGPDSTWTDQSTRLSMLSRPFLIADSQAQGTGSEMDEELISAVIDVDGFTNVGLKFTHDFHFNAANATMEQGDVDVRSSATNDLWVTVKTYVAETQTGTETIDLTPYKANNLQIRFHYYNANDDYYWAIDDIIVLGDDGYVCDVFDVDTDSDGVPDSLDNCTDVSNADQRDTNQDGYGNICDPDLNNDGYTNFGDLGHWVPFFNTATTGDEDLTGDGHATFGDYFIIVDYFLNGNSPPGPSGVAP